MAENIKCPKCKAEITDLSVTALTSSGGNTWLDNGKLAISWDDQSEPHSHEFTCPHCNTVLTNSPAQAEKFLKGEIDLADEKIDVTIVIAKDGITGPVTDSVKEALKRLVWAGDQAVAMQLWSSEDVITRGKDRGFRISPEQAAAVMVQVDRRQDASLGINWDTLDIYIDDIEEECPHFEEGECPYPSDAGCFECKLCDSIPVGKPSCETCGDKVCPHNGQVRAPTYTDCYTRRAR